jgi:hypothetical protein
VPVEEPVAMHVGERLQDLENDGAHGRVRKRLGRLAHEAEQVALDVLEDKIQAIVLADDLLQLHHVGMVQLLQGLHLQGFNDNGCFHIRENQKTAQKSVFTKSIIPAVRLRIRIQYNADFKKFRSGFRSSECRIS